MKRWRLRRGHSLEVIFEEDSQRPEQEQQGRTGDEEMPEESRRGRVRGRETARLANRPRARSVELTDEDSWTEDNQRRLSRRSILYQKDWYEEEEEEEEEEGEEAELVVGEEEGVKIERERVTCCQCHQEMDVQTNVLAAEAARRRNSTYLALACANAVSQGAMTRRFRQMFENPPVKESQPLLSKAEVQQAILESKMRRNSIAYGASTTLSQLDTDPTNPETNITCLPAAPVATATPPIKPAKPAKPTPNLANADRVVIQPGSPLPGLIGIRCEKCSSILVTSPVPVPTAVLDPVPVPAPVEKAVEEEKVTSKIVVPSNREVVEEELPKPDTVKNARCLFESSLMMEGSSGFSTLQHVKSNPSSKILRSESTMTLDRASARMPFRWPSRTEHIRHRSPSPSPSPTPSPIPNKLTNFKASTNLTAGPSYYRSTPSLYQRQSHPQQRNATQQQRHSRHSTDVESYISESECWSSDLESEASYSASNASSSGREDPSDGQDGMRYIAPDVMEKIRSYGMTLTFVNGKMVDEDEEEEDEEEEEDDREPTKATQKVVQSIRSAGQSRGPTNVAVAAKKHASVAAAAAAAKAPQKAELPAPKQPRIVACLPKPSEVVVVKKEEKKRHGSGESSGSSGSSGVSSGGDNISEYSSPFATLKRTKSAEEQAALMLLDRGPSPGPGAKSLGSSPFGCYSVVYNFGSGPAGPTSNNNTNTAARSPMFV